MEIIENIDKELLKKLYTYLVDNNYSFLRQWDLKILYHHLILKDINKVKEVFLKASLDSTGLDKEGAILKFEENWILAMFILHSLKLLDDNYNLTFKL